MRENEALKADSEWIRGTPLAPKWRSWRR